MPKMTLTREERRAGLDLRMFLPTRAPARKSAQAKVSVRNRPRFKVEQDPDGVHFCIDGTWFDLVVDGRYDGYNQKKARVNAARELRAALKKLAGVR